MNLYHSINIKDLKKYSFIQFKNWFIQIMHEDYEYIKSLKYYGFRVMFNKNSIYWKESKLYPIYPWKKDFKNIYIKNEKNILKWLYNKNRLLYITWKKINLKK